VSAWEEVRGTGAFGRDASIELYRCVRAVARAGNYPPPEGHLSWTVDAVIETAHEVFADRRGPQRLVELAVKASDDRSFRRLLEQVVRNFLRDRARATARGRLIRRLRDLLDGDPRFTAVPADRPGAGNVELADGSSAGVWAGRDSDLLAAAYKVTDVPLVRWRPQARREPPVADGASLLAVCEAVLRAGGGSLRLADLAEVVASRFAVGRGPVVTPVDDLESWAPPPQVIVGAPDGDAEIDTAAELLIAQLTPRERLVLAYLHLPIREIADRTGLGKSTAAELASRVKGIVAQVLGNIDEREAVLARARVLVTPTAR